MPRPARSRQTRNGRLRAQRELSASVEPVAAKTSDIYDATPPRRRSSRLSSSVIPDPDPQATDIVDDAILGTSLTLGQKSLLEQAGRRRDVAMDRLEAEDATTSAAAADDSGSNSELSIELGRRDVGSTPPRRDTTGLDVDDDIFGLDSSFGDAEPSRGRRLSFNSANTSTLSMGKKRRSRQPSIVGREDGPIRPSSRGLNTPSVSSTFNISHFRRRVREPSILGASRNTMGDQSTTVDQYASEAENDEFAPDAESTPLHLRKARATSVPSGQSAEPAANSRKRKSTESHQHVEHPGKSSRVESEDLDPLPNSPAPEHRNESSESDLESLSDEDPLPSPLASPVPAELARPVTPINYSMGDIMAPPASSESEASPVAWPSIRTLAKRRRHVNPTTPVRNGEEDDMFSDISSPPSLTHSPNLQPRTRGRPTQRQPSPKVMTADLTSLLPQRRHKVIPRDSLDLSGSEDEPTLAQNEEDRSYLDTYAARRRRDNRSRSRLGSARRPGSRQTSRPGSRAGPPPSVLKARPTPLGKSKRLSRTYGSRLSDKENEDGLEDSSFGPLPDETFEASDSNQAVSSEELKTAAKKFKEVDRWELEFEEVTASSP